MQEGTTTVNINAKVAQLTQTPAGQCPYPCAHTGSYYHFRPFDTSPDVAVVVLQTEGERAFCGGAALHDLATATSLEEATEFFILTRLINALRRFPNLHSTSTRKMRGWSPGSL